MSKKLLARIGLLVIVLFGVTILTFFYTNLSPVDAAEALAVRRYNRPTPQQVELVREELGLDQPILQQHGSWLWNALHGDFGNSYNTGRPIVEELSASIRPTLVMAGLGLPFFPPARRTRLWLPWRSCLPLCSVFRWGCCPPAEKAAWRIGASTCSASSVCLCRIIGSASCSCSPSRFISPFSALWERIA